MTDAAHERNRATVEAAFRAAVDHIQSARRIMHTLDRGRMHLGIDDAHRAEYHIRQVAEDCYGITL